MAVKLAATGRCVEPPGCDFPLDIIYILDRD